MLHICMYFQVHQPYRLAPYTIFDSEQNRPYFDDETNSQLINKVAQTCYLKTNEILYNIIQRHPTFRCAFSFSGVFLEQCAEYAPEVLASFQKLIATGNVEVLGETYYHSLAFVYSKPEFKKQVKLHSKTIKLLFDVTPRVLRNTELIYQNELADLAHELGFHGVLAEGAQKMLGDRSPHFVYTNHTRHMPLLLKDYQLSDDIAFRFSDKNWSKHPLTVDRYVDWINQTHGNGTTINLFMDYETFGEHQWASTGIFDFLDHLPDKILARSDNQFSTPSDVIAHNCPVDRVDVPYYTSWADTDRDLSAWLGNDLQTTAAHALYELEPIIKTIDNADLAHNWRKLQTSDHVYYMCTKLFNDGDVHAYFSPYDSPYDGFLYFMNSLHNLKRQLHEHRTDHHSSSRSRNQVSAIHKSSCQGNDSIA